MIGTATQRRTLEVELTSQDGVSLDDTLPASPDEPYDEAARVQPVAALPGVILGELAGIDSNGRPLVELPRSSHGEAVVARSTVALGEMDIGRQLVVMFVEGDPGMPIVLGILQAPQPPQSETALGAPEQPGTFEARLDGERVILAANREIVLRCGKTSITLTRAGKVLIRGAYLLSRSSGVNRIKGGSVQIN